MSGVKRKSLFKTHNPLRDQSMALHARKTLEQKAALKHCEDIDNKYDAIVPMQSEKIQPLAALYHRRVSQKAEKLLQQNKRSMKSLLDQLNVCYVPIPKDEQVFININAITDWPKD